MSPNGFSGACTVFSVLMLTTAAPAFFASSLKSGRLAACAVDDRTTATMSSSNAK